MFLKAVAATHPVILTLIKNNDNNNNKNQTQCHKLSTEVTLHANQQLFLTFVVGVPPNCQSLSSDVPFHWLGIAFQL